MKKEKKEKIRIKERISKIPKPHLRRSKAGKESDAAADGSFAVYVQSSEPILRLKDTKEKPVWQKDLVCNCSLAALLTVAMALFCMSIDSPELIPFVLTCPVVFMAVATTGSVKEGKVKWIVVGVLAVILLAAAIIWRGGIFGGISMLINQFYDAAEQAQAYLYDRLEAGYEASDGEARAGLAWIAGLIGLIAALPPVKARRGLSGAVVILTMLAFAYYGLIPSAVCIAVMITALIVAVARGSILSFVPLILAALVIFGAVVLADPGENYEISRMNETFRDRFALKSVLLETDGSVYEDLDEEDYEEDLEEEEEDWSEEEDADYTSYAIYGIIIFAVLALGAAGYLLHRRIAKKRALIRKGIDSKDSREAITAMFPYAVRWLKGYGFEQPGPSFMSMEPALRSEFSDHYANLFTEMYDLWREAAYSDHEIPERSRLLMETFTEDTVKYVKDKCKLRDKLRLRLRYAL